MKNLTSTELGFVPEGEAEASFEHQIIMQRKKQAHKQYSTNYSTISQQSLISKSTILQYALT